ncbi:hypothetical protein PMZ80_001348 [Knufia obscura]|uniref:CCZ1/INTU/HSP4 first Longin domain-containing protein n=1 Tax=Knufia obscura TaxID=1635080 RepID=A0ABR0S2X5_9EURO|nr:hypothetical protein PMZ80_001348 [Knufia obscura]
MNEEPRVIPAQLDFLAIYNPTLSNSDDTFKDQIVYYFSRRSRRQARHGEQKHNTEQAEDEYNKRLRQIGLAQGMVSFAKNFSDSNVDTIETDKSRVVLHELEQDWWILASIDLTRLPSAKTPSQENNHTAGTEYSAREVSPATLLVAQLVEANSLFLLHHATKLSELFGRVGRDVFCGLLERYWNTFVRNWDVLLHGNPATSIYNAIKLSGGGELGIGVGEEEWGSGEREVLEDFIDRTEGLRDLVVGRYGLPPETERSATADKTDATTWLGTGNDPVAADGVVFSGKGLISKQSLRTVSQWMEAIFKHGNDAYGIGENPSSRPRQRRKRQKLERSPSGESVSSNQETHPRLISPKGRASNLRKKAIENHASPPGIPAPLVGQVERSLNQALAKADADKTSSKEKSQKQPSASNTTREDSSLFGTESMMKYMKLGYGTSWTLNPKGFDKSSSDGQSTTTNPASSNTGPDESNLQQVDPTPEVSEDEKPFRQRLEQSIGKFLIGLSGDLEQTELEEDNENGPDVSNVQRSDQRLFLRTLTIEMARPRQQKRNTTIRTSSYDSQKSNRSTGSMKSTKTTKAPPTSASASVDGRQPHVIYEKVQVAVYVHQPFIFIFLFELHTPSLTMPSFYRSIHNQLGPLQKPLLRSTDPSRVAERIAEAMDEKNKKGATSTLPEAGNAIYDLVYDPIKLTIRTSIPNIPVPGSLAAEGLTSSSSSYLSVSGAWYTLGIPIGSSNDNATSTNSDKLVKSSWSRTEALNAHTQVLNTYLATRSGKEIEHTVKTARGWWVLWMKVLPSQSEINKQKNVAGAHDNGRPASPSPASLTARRGSQHKEAFLVRKAADFNPRAVTQSRAMSTGPGKWLLREQKRDVSGATTVGGAASAKGVSDGVGVDARRWVEGLLMLTQ